MTEINFYVSKEIGLNHRFSIAYQLLNKGLQRNLNIHIHTDSEHTSKKIDDYIWIKDNISFIPHEIVNEETDNSMTPPIQKQVNISHNYEPLTRCDYLINLSNERPAFFSRFLKVAEILDNDDEIITAGRQRYSFYRDRGYTLNYYQL